MVRRTGLGPFEFEERQYFEALREATSRLDRGLPGSFTLTLGSLRWVNGGDGGDQLVTLMAMMRH